MGRREGQYEEWGEGRGNIKNGEKGGKGRTMDLLLGGYSEYLAYVPIGVLKKHTFSYL